MFFLFKQISHLMDISLRTKPGRLTKQPGHSFRSGLLGFAAVFIHIALLPQNAHAVRPFVTDDARIIDVGQIEVESWLEVGHADSTWNPAPAVNFMAGATVNDWLEIIVGSGVARGGNGKFAMPNPVLQPKLLLMAAEKNGRPGFALGAGATFDAGVGDLHHRGNSAYLIGMTTWRLYDDWLMTHINYGARMDKSRNDSAKYRPYWGIGLDAGLIKEEIRLIVEAYAGDPLDLHAPKTAAQMGFRWLASDYVNLDLTVGVQPELHEHTRNRTGSAEVWGQIGLRLLFDAFTPGGRRGDPMGARGMFVR